ncbi:unannotated protein [freshwater metagenome]|uniref:Unannotated protein n=1 Tax=freshwater metagenome TaxID=449393 RepID=A0A6J6L7X4_9ZZZZ|nr:hypothetical protein [Actinomycetota bacterium]
MASLTIGTTSGPSRLARKSLYVLAGVPLGIVFLAVWSVLVGTSPTLSTEERIRGWESVVRELPATLTLILIVCAGIVLAIRAGRNGEVSAALQAIWLHGVGLYVVLAIVTGGSAENIMETRSSTVKWLLFPAQVVVTGLVVLAARRMAVSRPKP